MMASFDGREHAMTDPTSDDGSTPTQRDARYGFQKAHDFPDVQSIYDQALASRPDDGD
jgi:hypothetical protein